MKSTSWQEGMKDIADARDKVWWCTDRHFTDKGGVASHKQENAKAGVIVQISFLQGISQGKFPSNLPTSCQTKKKYFAK